MAWGLTVAPIAVEEVLAETESNPADPTAVTVVYTLIWVVVPELALGAIIARHPLAAAAAVLLSGLSRLAKHT